MTRRFVHGIVALLTTVLLCETFSFCCANDENRLTPDSVRAAAEQLRQENVAWRNIAWKSCLLEGIAESRATGKPMILWIFIDRPIDDERC